MTSQNSKKSIVQDTINFYGVKANNLKNIDVKIPKNKLVVFCGVSGSGKTSLAFDTIYAEAERRYVESLSSYARQFLGVKDKPNIDKAENLSPAISIDQRSLMRNPRSTVGTITEIYDYLRILYSNIGEPLCPNCHQPIQSQTVSQIVNHILKLPAKTEFLILSPIFQDKKGENKNVIDEIYKLGFPRGRFDGQIWKLEELLEKDIDKNKKHTLEIVIDNLSIVKDIERNRISSSVELALKMGKGIIYVSIQKGDLNVIKNDPQYNFSNQNDSDIIFSEHFACNTCGFNMPKIEPRLFSFNNPIGACKRCTGIGNLISVDPDLIIPNKDLTLDEGAIHAWAGASHRIGRQGYFWWLLAGLAEKYKFSLNVPVKNLPENILHLIYYGDKDQGGDFEGVINNLERRWKESDSEWTKKEIEKYMHNTICPECNGLRLNKYALSVFINHKHIADINQMTVDESIEFFNNLKNHITGSKKEIATPLIKEILARLNFLKDVSLNYLTISRESTTLSGGEAQRIRLATQISSGLSNIIYVLDEPSIGLHPRDQKRLIDNLKKLRDLNNTVIVVEHDEQTIMSADWVIEIGPKAGKFGGEIVFQGTPKELLKSKTLTGQYLSQKLKVDLNKDKKRNQNSASISLVGCNKHNLKNINVEFPLGKLIGVTGVSGSGKSTLVMDVLYPAIIKYLKMNSDNDVAYQAIKGVGNIDRCILVDQEPIGRTPRSNPVTYIGIFNYIRDLFSKTELSKMRGYDAGRFSFNVKGGRCESCQGDGYKTIEMYFLPDVYTVCDECHGTRFNDETLEVTFKDKNISDVLEMSVDEALKFFKDIPIIKNKLQLLSDVGLSYMKLGQSSTTLSGGEAQRVKLAEELSKRDTGKTLYILDEPTTGLHFDDIKKLLNILNLLVEKGNTVIVIEHELDVIKNCDYIIDLGPEGGNQGGEVIATGSVKDIKNNKKSYTAKFLK
mgnify:FL=1